MADWTPISEDELAEIEARENAAGEIVHVRAAGGRTLERRVVRDLGEIVLICKDDDFERARGLGIEPPSMAFHRDDVISATEQNAEVVANARTDVPRLVAELRRTREALREAREYLASAAGSLWSYDRSYGGGRGEEEAREIAVKFLGYEGDEEIGDFLSEKMRSSLRIEPEAEPRG